MSSLPALLEQYSNLILSVEDDDNNDPLWLRFYQIQMASFILGSKSVDLELQNALKAYDLILDAWQGLEETIEESIIPIKNYDNIFKEVFIDFWN